MHDDEPVQPYRRAQYSVHVGYSLTDEQCDAIDHVAEQMAIAYPMSIGTARWHVLNVIRIESTLVVIQIAATAVANTLCTALRAFNNCTAPPLMPAQTVQDIIQRIQDAQHGHCREAHWWHGLEDMIERNTRAQGRMKAHGVRTYGRYRLAHTGRQASYWRHTRTR